MTICLQLPQAVNSLAGEPPVARKRQEGGAGSKESGKNITENQWLNFSLIPRGHIGHIELIGPQGGINKALSAGRMKERSGDAKKF